MAHWPCVAYLRRTAAWTIDADWAIKSDEPPYGDTEPRSSIAYAEKHTSDERATTTTTTLSLSLYLPHSLTLITGAKLRDNVDFFLSPPLNEACVILPSLSFYAWMKACTVKVF